MANPSDDSLGGGATRMGGNKREDRDGLSLGDQATLGGGMIHDTSRSLGDAVTLGGVADAQSDELGNEMEIVDLSSRYTIESVLGKGGMGEVLLATDNRLKRKVAIKRVLGEMARSKTAVRRFLTEAQSVAALNHFNIVQIYDYGRDKDGPFLIMEYVDGSSLLDRCRNGAIPIEEAIDITCQLCDGLGRAHELGIIHRDIKPANILLTKDGKPKLTDFGLAKQDTTDHGQTIAGAVLGTLDFMPPEQRRDAALTDTRSDLWSLAATLYQMVTGRSPKIIRFDLLPPSLTSVLGKALEEKMEDRYQTASELRSALQAALQPVDTGEVELITGQCPSCNTKNEAGRKFCRKCAASLEVPCLSCSKGMQLWDEVCGQCGTQQTPLLEQRKAEMHEQQQQAESLRQDFQFHQAIQIATLLRDVPDLRLQQLKGWSDRFLTDIHEDIKEQHQRSGKILIEAIAHEAAYDDDAGIRAIEKIPKPLRGEMLTVAGSSISPNQMITRLTQRKSKTDQLEKTIKKCLEGRDLNGLLPKVEEFLKYRPNRTDIIQLKEQLDDRAQKLIETRDKALAEATELLTAQRYPEVIAALQAVDPSVETRKLIELRKTAEKKNNQVLQLRKMIQQGVTNKSYDSLLEPVEELLSLVSTDEPIQKLREQLLSRDKNLQGQIEQIVIQANKLREICQFQQASDALSKIPASRKVKDVQCLIADCNSLAFHRSRTILNLKRIISEQRYTQGAQASYEYDNALNRSGIQDPEFQQLRQQCNQGLAIQEAKIRKIIKVSSAVAAGAVLLCLGIWIYFEVRSSMRDKVIAESIAAQQREAVMRDKAIAESIAAQQWEAVLGLEPKNIQALLGRARVRVNQQPPDYAGALKDLEAVESIDSQTVGLNEVKAAALAKRSQSYAENGKIVEAESDFQSAEKLGAVGTIIAESKKSLGQAYSKRAEASVAAKQLTAAISDTTKALQYAPELKLSEPLLVASTENAIETFDQNPSDMNRKTALDSINNLESQYPIVPQLKSLKQRVRSMLLKRIPQQITAGDLEKAISEITTTLELGAEENEIIASKSSLVTALTVSLRKSIFSEDYGRASIDVAKISQLDLSAVNDLPVAWENFPTEVLSQLPAEVLSQLPSRALAKLPPLVNSLGMSLKKIAAGTFTMGEGDDFYSNNQSHNVTLTRPFYIGVYEVTQEEYQRVMGSNPSNFEGSKNPVENVSWNEAAAFCKKLSELPEEKSAGRIYRLPTEAEWEYACRAGSRTIYSFGNDEKLSQNLPDNLVDNLGDYAWSRENSRYNTHPVGQKNPNAWGLYDMHGNVFEWCQDWYAPYPSSATTNPQGPSGGSNRINRGGSWSDFGGSSRSANRYHHSPDSSRSYNLGFRVAMDSPVE